MATSFRTCVIASVIEKRLSIVARTPAIKIVLRGIHQAISEIHEDLNYVLSRIYRDAIVLCIGHRQRGADVGVGRTWERSTRAKRPADEIHD